MPESIQHKLDRVRPPRVQITYDVQIGDAIEKKELPFVVGIMANLSGTPNPDKKPSTPALRERKFVEIDRDNFNDVLASIGPELKFTADINLTKDGTGFKLTENFVNRLKETLTNEYASSEQMDEALKEAEKKLRSDDGRDSNRAIIGKERFKARLKDALGSDKMSKLKEDDYVLAKETPSWITAAGLDKDTLNVSLKFRHLDDFLPVKVLTQVKELNQLFEARKLLNDLLAKLDGNDDFLKKLKELANDTNKRQEALTAAGLLTKATNDDPSKNKDASDPSKNKDASDPSKNKDASDPSKNPGSDPSTSK